MVVVACRGHGGDCSGNVTDCEGGTWTFIAVLTAVIIILTK